MLLNILPNFRSTGSSDLHIKQEREQAERLRCHSYDASDNHVYYNGGDDTNDDDDTPISLVHRMQPRPRSHSPVVEEPTGMLYQTAAISCTSAGVFVHFFNICNLNCCKNIYKTRFYDLQSILHLYECWFE